MSAAITPQSSTSTPASTEAGVDVERINTARDWLDVLGNVPPERILFDPPPGQATEADVLRLNDHNDRLCELIDGTLVEKGVGQTESIIAGRIIFFLNLIAISKKLGHVSGEAGMIRMFNGRVRMPDVSYFSFARLPDGKMPAVPVPAVVPDLAVEIISDSNTRREMEIKLAEYFEGGTRLVWYVYPETKTIDVYTSAAAPTKLTPTDRLTGGDVLPEFDVAVADVFDVG